MTLVKSLKIINALENKINHHAKNNCGKGYDIYILPEGKKITYRFKRGAYKKTKLKNKQKPL